MDGERALTQGMIDAKIRPGGSIRYVTDNNLNDSDKSFVCPAGKIWHIFLVGAQLVATATAGNRTLKVHVYNGAVGVGQIIYGAYGTGNITANQTGVLWAHTGDVNSTGAQKAPTLSGGTATNVIVDGPLPSELYLLPGYTLRIWDSAAIDAAADDLYTVIGYVEYDQV